MAGVIINDPQISYRVDGGWIDALTGVLTPDLGWPTADTVGIDAISGWEPVAEYDMTGNAMSIFEDDAVIEDIRVIGGPIIVRASNVTLRRVECINGGFLNDYSGIIYNHTIYEDCTARGVPAGTAASANAAFGTCGGYTCRRCASIGHTEGPHTGGSNQPLSDPTHPLGYTAKLVDSYFSITGPVPCEGIDYHGDVIQGVDGGLGGVPCTIRNCVLWSFDQLPDCGGTGCLNSGPLDSQPWDVDGLLCYGTAAPLRPEAGGTFLNTYVVDGSWVFYPIGLTTEQWATVPTWECWTCTVDAAGQVDTLVNRIPHGYPGFGPLDPP